MMPENLIERAKLTTKRHQSSTAPMKPKRKHGD